ncbi:hypothetical protein B0H13DRAFT_1889999 [Mycena leptocephala]|nr:hypothetical protein B0H13DRAFT_1889999 [Mycena leptocephala]
MGSVCSAAGVEPVSTKKRMNTAGQACVSENRARISIQMSPVNGNGGWGKEVWWWDTGSSYVTQMGNIFIPRVTGLVADVAVLYVTVCGGPTDEVGADVTAAYQPGAARGWQNTQLAVTVATPRDAPDSGLEANGAVFICGESDSPHIYCDSDKLRTPADPITVYFCSIRGQLRRPQGSKEAVPESRCLSPSVDGEWGKELWH